MFSLDLMWRLVLVAAILFSTVAVEPADSRNIAWIPYDELFAKSDLVVIAEPVTKTRDTAEHAVLTEDISPGVSAVGVVTDFDCLLVLKGGKKKRFTLHHYRWAPARKDAVMVNGPTFTAYEPQLQPRPFLMFLVRERDGRFAPAAGQIDPAISVQEVRRM